MKRRTLIAAAVGVPALLRSASEKTGYTYTEVDKMLARGDIRGRLSLDDLPTPALVLDLDAFEANVSKMVQHCKQSGRALRPHGKTHKCPEIAKILMRAGAVGACAAKLSEAEVFAANGVTGLLVTTAVIGKHKIERAVRLASQRRDTIFSVDNAQNVQDLNLAAGLAKVRLNVAIDLLVGGRTGIQSGEAALGLAQQISKQPNLKLAAIQAYAGQASHVIGFAERKKSSLAAMTPAVETAALIRKSGIECPVVTGGSTGTYNIDSGIDGVTELQPGSFMFMDLDYNRIGGQDGAIYKDFQNSLTVLTTVVSKPSDQVAIVDGGFKAFSTDRPFMPEARGVNGLVFSWGGDEHGRLSLAKASRTLNVGDRLPFVIPHCDPSVNLYDRIYGTRGSKVESVWKIAARGMSQ